MTATMSNPTIPLPAETGAVEQRAAAFAAAVRERLSDLPTDEVDELLDGLQGDLTERLAESADAGDVGTGELGDPEAYADELRQAAGLPSGAMRTRRRRVGRCASRYGTPGLRRVNASKRIGVPRRGVERFETSCSRYGRFGG